jgi:hypothetical protein
MTVLRITSSPRLLSLVALVALAAGCGSGSDAATAGDPENVEEAACKASRAQTERVEETDAGTVLSTRISTKGTACIASSKRGDAILEELAAIASDDEAFANLSTDKGKYFEKYEASKPTGDLTTSGLERTVNVSLHRNGVDPSTTVKVTLKKEAGAKLTLHITNTTSLSPRLLNVALGTVIEAGGIDVTLTAVPTKNGAMVSATASFDVKHGYEDHFGAVDEVLDLAGAWLQRQVTQHEK